MKKIIPLTLLSVFALVLSLELKAADLVQESYTSDLINNSRVKTKIEKHREKNIHVTTKIFSVNLDVLSSLDKMSDHEVQIPLTIEVEEGLVLGLERIRVQLRSEKDFTWYGKVAGVPASQVIIVVQNGTLTGNIEVNNQIYVIRYFGEGMHVVSKVDSTQFKDELPPLTPNISERQEPGKSEDEPIAEADSASQIDVLVLYTAAVAAASGNIQAEVQMTIDQVNAVYASSGITPRVRLVKAIQVDYSETGESSTDLSRLQNTSDGYIDVAHTFRNQYGADLVSLWVENMSGYCGIAYLLDDINSDFGPWAFSVVQRGCATGNYSFAHEMGHNQGAHHDTGVNPEDGLFSSSHGHLDSSVVSKHFRTVMAYSTTCGTCVRKGFFSNPDVSEPDSNKPTGVGGTSENAATLNASASKTANYRQAVSSGGEDKDSAEGCFIATAAYGSYWEPEVKVLRNFRDSVLLKTYWGRDFVQWYYRTSPPYAEWIADHDWARLLVQWSLAPFVFLFVYPWWVTGSFFAGVSFLIRRRRKWKG